MIFRRSHFLLVEAERYRHLAERSTDDEQAARWRRVVAEYEDLARRFDEHCELVREEAPRRGGSVGLR
jgi:hypothetical protein